MTKALVRFLVAVVDRVVGVILCAIVVSELNETLAVSPVGAGRCGVGTIICLNKSAGSFCMYRTPTEEVQAELVLGKVELPDCSSLVIEMGSFSSASYSWSCRAVRRNLVVVR